MVSLRREAKRAQDASNCSISEIFHTCKQTSTPIGSGRPSSHVLLSDIICPSQYHPHPRTFSCGLLCQIVYIIALCPVSPRLRLCEARCRFPPTQVRLGPRPSLILDRRCSWRRRFPWHHLQVAKPQTEAQRILEHGSKPVLDLGSPDAWLLLLRLLGGESSLRPLPCQRPLPFGPGLGHGKCRRPVAPQFNVSLQSRWSLRAAMNGTIGDARDTKPEVVFVSASVVRKWTAPGPDTNKPLRIPTKAFRPPAITVTGHEF